ncbi:MAG TPA: DUF2237 domain-containing protein [Vampirovibrionales bacterium]
MQEKQNVFGEPLKACCYKPLTGYFRDGYCRTDSADYGLHVICAEVTEEFLNYSKLKGNDLITQKPEWNFPGLKPGDKWCLCAQRWLEAHKVGYAPPLHLESSDKKALEIIELEILKQYAAK